MPRIRTIKPELPHSESMGKVSRESRLCFILLWTLADDEGRMRGNAKMLASLLYPYDGDAPKHIEGWLAELEREACIQRYAIEGNSFLQVCNWTKHQKIDRPTTSKFPAPPADSRGLAKAREDSRGLDEDSTKAREDSSEDRDLRTEGSEDQRTTTRAGRSRSVSVERPDEIPDELWSAWMVIRKAKRAPITEAALGIIKEEAAKANWTLVAAIRECVSRGWQGFKAEWVAKASSLGATPPPLNKFAKPVTHMPNMPLGAPSCGCNDCVGYREKRMVTA